MARLKEVAEAPSLKHYRNWWDAREASKDAAGEVGLLVKQAVSDLQVGKKAWKLACELKRQDPIKSAAFLRDFDRLAEEFNLRAQLALLDEIEDTESAA